MSHHDFMKYLDWLEKDLATNQARTLLEDW